MSVSVADITDPWIIFFEIFLSPVKTNEGTESVSERVKLNTRERV